MWTGAGLFYGGMYMFMVLVLVYDMSLKVIV